MNGEAPQRRSQRTRPRCIREGCERTIRDQDRPACSYLCRFMAQQMEEAERVCRATGDSASWAAAVSLNDALTEYFDCKKRTYDAALSVGITKPQWVAIKLGHSEDVVSQGRVAP